MWRAPDTDLKSWGAAHNVLALVTGMSLAALLLWLLPQVCELWWLAPLAPHIGNALRVTVLVEIGVAFGGIWLVHRLDETGIGLIGRYRNFAGLKAPDPDTAPQRLWLRAAFLESDKGAVGAFITKQSIFAALAVALIGALYGAGEPDRLHGVAVPCYYGSLLVTLTSLVTVLVSIECYSSVLRYHWPVLHRTDLLIKARTLDGWSFYLLVLGLLLGVTVRYPAIAAPVIFAFTWLLVRWFYFPPAD